VREVMRVGSLREGGRKGGKGRRERRVRKKKDKLKEGE